MTLRFRGVFVSGSRWDARIKHNGKRHNLGLFDEEEDAARAYDAKARELGLEEHWLNYPVGLHLREGPPPSRRSIKPVGAAGFRGVRLQPSGRYQAKFLSGSKNTYSSHDTAEAAARAWDAMAREAGRSEVGLNFPRGGQPNAAALAAPSSSRAAKRRRAASAERAHVEQSFEDEEPRAGAGEEEAADPAAWLTEAENASPPRLRELLQAAERRAAARAAHRSAADAAAAASAAFLAALVAADASEAAASARLRQLLPAVERAAARLARRRAAEEAAREAEEAAAEAATLLAQAEAMAAELAGGTDDDSASEGGTEIMGAR